MSRRGWITIGLLLVVAVVVTGILLSRRDGDQETAVVYRGSLDVTVQTVGVTAASNPILARSQVAGALLQFGARLGDRVGEGDILAMLDQTPFQQAVELAERDVVDAEYGLQLAELRVAAAPDVPEIQLEVLAAQSRVERAREAVRVAKENLQKTVVLAPTNGIVLETLVQEGSLLVASQPVVQLYQPDDVELIAQLDELDLPNVEPNSKVAVRLDAYPGMELPGVVTLISPQAVEQGGATVFQAIIDFDFPNDLDVRPGMNATVTIVTDERQDVLLVPETAIRTVGDRAFVVVVSGGDEEEREVILGQRGGGAAEVVDGLAEGDIVVVR
jgi:RND family efflux transporter MFP subunit